MWKTLEKWEITGKMKQLHWGEETRNTMRRREERERSAHGVDSRTWLRVSTGASQPTSTAEQSRAETRWGKERTPPRGAPRTLVFLLFCFDPLTYKNTHLLISWSRAIARLPLLVLSWFDLSVVHCAGEHHPVLSLTPLSSRSTTNQHK